MVESELVRMIRGAAIQLDQSSWREIAGIVLDRFDCQLGMCLEFDARELADTEAGFSVDVRSSQSFRNAELHYKGTVGGSLIGKHPELKIHICAHLFVLSDGRLITRPDAGKAFLSFDLIDLSDSTVGWRFLGYEVDVFDEFQL